MQFALIDGVYYAPKSIDETTEAKAPEGDPAEPFRINFRKCLKINSYGIRRLLGFIRAGSGRTLELHECTTPVISTLNIVRDILGPDRNPKVVKSLALPYFCQECDDCFDVMSTAAAVKLGQEDLGLPAKPCPTCGANCKVDQDAPDLLGFMESHQYPR